MGTLLQGPYSIVIGNNTNNYCEAGIRILKDIVFKRIKAYNLVQTFEFMTVTFELYYECRLLAVAYNRMDRYLSLRFKGLGASSIAERDITPSQSSPNTYIVKSQTYEGVEYQVDTAAWNCNCSVGWSGHPSGEPCKHQAAVAKVYKLSAPNLVPYFSNEGRYLHAVIAVGVTKAGEKSFYQRLTDTISAENEKGDEKGDIGNEAEANSDMEIIEDEGANNLDIMLYLIEQQEKTQQHEKGVKELMHKFVADIDSHIEQLDTQYLDGLLT